MSSPRTPFALSRRIKTRTRAPYTIIVVSSLSPALPEHIFDAQTAITEWGPEMLVFGRLWMARTAAGRFVM